MPETDQERIDKALQVVKGEMPDVAGASVLPMGTLDKIGAWLKSMSAGSPVQAQTSRSGAVAYNPEALKGLTQPEIEDMFAHELMHTRQSGRSGAPSLVGSMFGPHFSYKDDPAELEAYQFEAQRRATQKRSEVGDINLPTDKLPARGDLLQGTDKGVIAANVKTLMSRGFSQGAAIQRAMQEAGQSKG